MFENRIRLFTAFVLALVMILSAMPSTLAESSDSENTNILIIDGISPDHDPDIEDIVKNDELTGNLIPDSVDNDENVELAESPIPNIEDNVEITELTGYSIPDSVDNDENVELTESPIPNIEDNVEIAELTGYPIPDSDDDVESAELTESPVPEDEETILSAIPSIPAESSDLGDTNIFVIDGVTLVYDPNSEVYVENAELTENPVLYGDLKPEDPPQVPGVWEYDPVLKVIAGNMEDGGADSSFTVNGSVTMETTAAGPSIAVYADCLEKEADVVVNGDVSSTVTLEEAPPEYPKAIAYGTVARSAVGQVNITVDGTVTATGIAEETAQAEGTDLVEGEGRAFAVYADAVGPEGVTTVHITGDAVARSEGNENTEWEESYTIAVNTVTELNGTAVINVDGAAVAESTEHSFSAKAVDVYATTGSTAEITIGEGAEGQVAAKAKNDGTAKVTILDGGVTAVIKDPSEGSRLAAVHLWNGGETEDDDDENVKDLGNPGTLEINISGDVTASGASENIGIQIRTDEGGKTDVIVDGTVNASDAAVVLLTPETQIGENVSLTVWELKPNEDGAVISRLNEENHLQEDVQSEKSVQYIIRVKPDQLKIVTAQGTTEYNGFSVAHEGDTVTLLLNIPEGYEITGAYGDVDQNYMLLKDESGNYFLTVPRGGAVELSVKLEKIGEGDAAGAGAVRGVVYRILKITDQTEKAELSFFSNGRYVARYEDGTSENGSFRLTNETLVLMNDNDRDHAKMTAELNAEKDLYELLFHPSANPETNYIFMIAAKDFKTLTAIRYALRTF